MRSTQNINICCGPAEPVPLTRDPQYHHQLQTKHRFMTIDKETANQALATLEREKQEIKERFLRAAQARNT